MKIFYQNYNNVLNSIIPYYERTTNLLEADVVVVWNDLVAPQKEIVQLAREYGKKSIVVEHGMKAVSDYAKDFVDIHNNMGGKPFIADHICVWGKKSADIMLKAGVPKERVHIVGSPIIWNREFKYSHGKEEKVVPFMAGKNVVDPNTKERWELVAQRRVLPASQTRNVLYFSPYHDYTKYGREQNRKVYEQIKHRKDLFVVLSSNYGREEKENPFYDLFQIPIDKRRERCLILDFQRPSALQFTKAMLAKSKLLLTVIPGTVNGLAWCIDVPTLSPKIDWFWRNKKGKEIFDEYEANSVCEIKDLNKRIDKITECFPDGKQKAREKAAIEYMGVDAGDPAENIRKVIDNA